MWILKLTTNVLLQMLPEPQDTHQATALEWLLRTPEEVCGHPAHKDAYMQSASSFESIIVSNV